MIFWHNLSAYQNPYQKFWHSLGECQNRNSKFWHISAPYQKRQPEQLPSPYQNRSVYQNMYQKPTLQTFWYRKRKRRPG